MDKHMNQATEAFVTARIVFHGENEPAAVTETYIKLRSGVERLRETLNSEQAILLRDCENSYHEIDGETIRHYYTSGFRDAIAFILGWNPSVNGE